MGVRGVWCVCDNQRDVCVCVCVSWSSSEKRSDSLGGTPRGRMERRARVLRSFGRRFAYIYTPWLETMVHGDIGDR